MIFNCKCHTNYTNWIACLSFIYSDDGSFPYKTKHEQRHRASLTECFTEADLRNLSEFNPPALMPNGNVGTPVTVFLQLIQSCRLPPRIIRKLGLIFPKTGSSRRYGNVPFHYQDTQTLRVLEETVFTASGHEISGPGCLAAPAPGHLSDHSQTTESDEPQKEEEDQQSNADDVGLSVIHVASICVNCGLLLSLLVDFRMMTTVRSGSGTKLCTMT